MASLGACSKFSKKISEEGYLWQTMFRQRFPQSELTSKNMKYWKLLYQMSLTKIVDRLKCFSTQKTFFEDVLGVGVSYIHTVNPRTKNVDYIDLSQDLLSITAFKQFRIRADAFGNKFELFLPLYFTEDHFRRALPLIRKTIIRLWYPVARKGGDRNDTFEEMVLDVMPKIVNTFAVLLSDQGISASRKSFTGLLNIHRLFLALAHHFPNVKRVALLRLRKFVSSEQYRTKKSCPSLGSILPLLMVVDEKDFGWNDLRGTYLTENFDRGVLWCCTKYPQLEHTQDEFGRPETAEKAEERVCLTLDAMSVSLRLCMFHVYFYRSTCLGTTTQERANRYDRYFGQPEPTGPEAASTYHVMSFTHFRTQINHILTVNTWHGFFAFVGGRCPPSKLQWRDTCASTYKTRFGRTITKRACIFLVYMLVAQARFFPKGKRTALLLTFKGLSSGMCGATQAQTQSFLMRLVYKGKTLMDTVDYQNRNAQDGAILHSGDVMRDGGGTHTININLSALDQVITSCVFVISAWADAALSDIVSPSISFVDADAGGTDTAPLCVYDLDAHDKVSYLTSVIMCRLYRTMNGGWHVQAIGDAHEGAADNYGPIYAAVQKLL